MSVEFRLLGEVRARAGDEWIDLGHARQRCVLAGLLVEPNRPQPVEVLIERVWGDRPPRQARGTLYGYLYRLRQAFGDRHGLRIDRTQAGYVLPVDEDAVDLHRFRRLVQRSHHEHDLEALALVDTALGLWDGDALGALEGPWVDSVRRALEQERRHVVLHRNDIALRVGRHDTLLADLVALADDDPLDERVAGQLMLALYRSGRQADAFGHYQTVRDRLVEELGADPGPALRELHQQLLRSDGEVTGPPRAITPTPRQLPASPRLFVGRVDQLAEMDKALTPTRGESPALAVVGAAGTGKTTLALHWAHRAVDRFPDGQLHADLRGYDPSGAPDSPAAVVRRFLEALGVPAGGVPTDPDGQAALYRSLVAGRQLLVVLDNARDTHQVLPLLPGSSTCTVLITSRHRLTGLAATHGVPTLHLDVLTDTEARDLLARHLTDQRLHDEPDAVADLLGWCAGLPLAVGIVGARAAAHPDFPLRLLVDELRTTDELASPEVGEPTASLRAVFAASYRVLPPAAARALALLAIAPGPDIGLSAAGALLDLPTRRAHGLLHHLETSHLIRQHAPRRYRMHDLVRIYATERAHADHSDALPAARRLIGFYARTGRAAEAVLYPHEDPAALGDPVQADPDITDETTALSWLTAEYANLLAAQDAALRLGSHHHVWQLAWALDTFQRRQALLADHLTAWRTAATAADSAGRPGPRALAAWRLGAALARSGELTEATRHLTSALTLSRDAGDAPGQANAYQAMAWVCEQQGDDTAALHHATRALSILRTLRVPMREAHALNQAGWYAAKVGNLGQAREHCEAALVITREHRDRDAEARTLDSLGYIAHRSGNAHDAIAHYRQALSGFAATGASYDYADTLERLGDALAAVGDDSEARAAWRQAHSRFVDQRRAADAQRVGDRLHDSGS